MQLQILWLAAISLAFTINGWSQSASYQLAPSAISNITNCYLSPDAQHHLIIAEDPNGSKSGYFNGEKVSGFENIHRIGRSGVQFLSQAEDFYLVAMGKDFREMVITKKGVLGPLDGAAERAKVAEGGQLVFPYSHNDSTKIHHAGSDKLITANAAKIGNWQWNGGEYAIAYEMEQADRKKGEQQQQVIATPAGQYISGKAHKLYIDRVTFESDGEGFYAIFREMVNGERRQYVIGSAIDTLGPFEQLSEKITLAPGGECFGFAFIRDGKSYVQVNDQTYGPFGKAKMVSDLQFTGKGANDFAFYLVDENRQLHIQTAHSNMGPFQPKAFRGPMPALSEKGRLVRMSPSTPSGDYVQINEQVFGPYSNAPRNFYKRFVSEEITAFKFQKHGQTFLHADGNILGPFGAVDYQWDGKRLHLLSVDEDLSNASIQSYKKRKLSKVAPIDPNGSIIWKPVIQDHRLSLEVPFKWYSFNVNEKVRLLPMVMLAPKPTDFREITESLDAQKLPSTMHELVVFSLQGDAIADSTMRQVMLQNLEHGDEKEIVEDIHTKQVEGRECIALKAAIKRPQAEDLIMQQYAFKVNGEWILAQAYARSGEADDVFGSFGKMVGTIDVISQ